jgi:hypothetical protein
VRGVPRGQLPYIRDGADDGPVAYPVSGVPDLLGRMPVRLVAENGELAGYGFGDQRITIPAAEIGSAVVHGAGHRHGPGIVVLDASGRVLLRARGVWTGEVTGVFRALGLAQPEYLTRRASRNLRPNWPPAPSCRRLRTRPPSFRLLTGARILLWLLLCGLGIAAAVSLATMLPSSSGAVRQLVGTVLAVAAVGAAGYLTGLALRAARWVAISRQAGSLAPPGQFLRAGQEAVRRRRALQTLAMLAAIPVLIGWGPGVGIASLVHGLDDQRLVAQLRAQGVTTTGEVIDVPVTSTDSDGDTVVTEQATLLFIADGSSVQTPDPAIGGRVWPARSGEPVTIVYEQGDPDVAAVAGQVSGSPWQGAPTANVISGAILTALLPVLIWLTVRRLRAARQATREEFVEGLV